MNRKREEELMQLAFGDLRREECRSFASGIENDPEAEKMYGAYCEMREGLKALRDVPEMQLSTERLRDAILREGLAPKRESRFNFGWLAAPIAVGACAFVVVTAMRQPASPIPDAGGGLVVRNADPTDTGKIVLGGGSSEADPYNLRPFNFGNKEPVAPPVVTQVSDEASDEVSRPRVRNRTRVRRDTTVAMLETTKLPGLAVSLSSKPKALTLDQRAQAVALISSAPAAALDSGKVEDVSSTLSNDIVQIDSKVDTETGAARAVEVKGSQNVEIGG